MNKSEGIICLVLFINLYVMKLALLCFASLAYAHIQERTRFFAECFNFFLIKTQNYTYPPTPNALTWNYSRR